VLRRAVILKKDERIYWRKLPNEELYNLYCYSNISMIKSRRMRWTGHIACKGFGSVHEVLLGKPEGNRPLGWAKHRWENNIKINFKEMERGAC
jgi:hypothetical protein